MVSYFYVTSSFAHYLASLPYVMTSFLFLDIIFNDKSGSE